MKTILMIALMAVMTCGLFGCSNEDNVLAYAKDGYDIVVDFCLLNEIGERSTTFKTGENFIFCLSVSNNSGDYVKVADGYEHHFLGKDLFRVYSFEGRDMGVPWFLVDVDAKICYLYPYSQTEWSCPWLYNENYAPKHLLHMKKDNEPLPAGDYYSEFNLTIDQDHIIPCRIDFKVVE